MNSVPGLLATIVCLFMIGCASGPPAAPIGLNKSPANPEVQPTEAKN